MKYGVLSYERKALSLNGRDAQNMGDWVQTMAMESLFREMGMKDYLFVSRNDAAYYDGEEVRVVVNGYHSLFPRLGYKTETFPVSSKIEPVFLSMHFHDRCIPEEIKNQWVKYGPVGCRDEETLENLKRNGVPAYLSGCVTALFPRRTPDSARQNKVIVVDVSEELLSYIPEHIKDCAEYRTQLFPITRREGEAMMTAEESRVSYGRAKELLEYYRDNASLVITSRLHVASPCMAMGIPVILAKEDFDGRYAWIDRFLPLYGKDRWREIDWNPAPVEYEAEKECIKEDWKKLILSPEEKKETEHFSEIFYGERKRYTYNKLISNALKKLEGVCKSTKYALWGATEHALRVNNVIKDKLPNWELERVYDLNVKGCFEGVSICKPDEIGPEDKFLYLVIAPRAWNAAKEQLDKLGHDYVLVDVNSADWSYNIYVK